MAVVKPAGQFTQGTWAPPGEETLEQSVRRHLRPEDPANAYVGIVHRLDRPVSGLLLWAKTRKAARRLSKQFEARQVTKEYWAVVKATESSANPRAQPATQPSSTADESTSSRIEIWEDWLTPAGPDGRVRVVEPNAPGSRPARTAVQSHRLPNQTSGSTWLQMWPTTGRTHQLRVQAAMRGTPIVGDSIYGSDADFPIGIALHARSLKVRHPADKSELFLTAPLPETWSEFHLEQNGLDDDANPN